MSLLHQVSRIIARYACEYSSACRSPCFTCKKMYGNKPWLVFETSQVTISRAINNVLSLPDVVLPVTVSAATWGSQSPMVICLDGTLVPCWWWKNARNLHSGKHHRAGYNLQMLTGQANPPNHNYSDD